LSDTIHIELPRPISELLAEMSADCEFVHSVGDFTKAFEGLERESFTNHHASECMAALAMVSEQPRPLRDRLIDISEIVEARGKVTVTIKRMCK
jgi:hypothetical protein